MRDIRASITIVHVRKFFEINGNIVRFNPFSTIAKRSLQGLLYEQGTIARRFLSVGLQFFYLE